MMPLPSYDKLMPVMKHRAHQNILALDPGETTGYAIFESATCSKAGQLLTKDITTDTYTHLKQLLETVRYDIVVIESFRLYKWATEHQTWSDMYTSQLIGVLRLMCLQHELPVHFQSAQVAKQFVTDDKLQAWNLWQRGQKHARDAVRHGVYYLVHGVPNDS